MADTETKQKSKRPVLAVERPSAKPSGASRQAAEKLQDGEVRLAVNIPIRVHRAMKIRAAEQGRSMRELVLEIFSKAGFS